MKEIYLGEVKEKWKNKMSQNEHKVLFILILKYFILEFYLVSSTLNFINYVIILYF